MPFVDYETCEPLRIWNRLEPRSRQVDFDGALAATVHDPLWMLARQWQLGEFKAEDTGSAVLAKLARRLTPVASVRVGDGAFEAEDLSLPAEARVERLPIEFPVIVRAQLGRSFLIMLDEEAAAQPPAGTPYDAVAYRTLFRGEFRIDPPAAPGSDPVAIAEARVADRARRVNDALAGRAVDGVELYRSLVAGMRVADLPRGLAAGIVPEHETFVLAALERYRTWVERLYPDPPAAEGWDATQLEYQAACRLPRADGEVTLTVDEHVTGRLDWSAFDQGSVDTTATPASTTDVRTVIPAPAEFAGMPRPRWWEFEDGAIDLGNFRAQATDLAKIVVAEFALVYGNNWFVVPYSQPVGSLAEIEGVVVTDVFGRRTLVRPAVDSSGGKWTSWDLFSLSPRGTALAAPPPLPQHLFLPAVSGQVLDAEPHETVALVRDESADMVWGVERRVADGLGGSRDGTEAARRFADALAAELPDEGPPEEGTARLRFRLGTEVPESWIPFLPVHTPQSTRQIHLQRAAMPRFLPDGPQPVRPRTSILKPGQVGTELPSYFLNEEEVPRAGVNVQGTLRRARWLDGATVVWHGRTVVSGRGEADSGLRFDVVERRDPRP
jgi:hypothetical protein